MDYTKMTMSSMSQLTLADGQTTPANHLFTPVNNGAGDGVCRWQDREHNGGIAIGFSSITFSVREPTKVGGVHRVQAAISVPKLDTSTVVPTVVGVGRANIEFVYPGVFTAGDRADLRVFMTNLLGGAALGGNIQEMVRPY